MEKTEPTFIPEWLKSTTSHQFTSSSLHHDEKGGSKSARNKSLTTNNENELGRPSVSDRTTSSYFRRASFNNGSAHLRSHENRNHRERNWDKEKLDNNRNRDYSDPDPLGNILPTRFEKDGLRRSHSSVSNKRVDSWPRKISSDLTIGTKTGQNNGPISGKTLFERDFPSLNDEKDSEIGRVPSPGLTSAIQSLPIGNNAVIGGDGWTSALAEVPVIVGSNGNGQQTGQPNSGLTGGRNMAETLAHGPPRTQTAPQLTVGTQRLEELAVKQSRQLIPMTPSMPKALADKPKLKVGQSQLQNSHLTNHPNTPRSAAIKPEVSKPLSTAGKLLVLKPARERNGISPTAKDSLSPTTKLPNSPLAVTSVVPNAPVLEKKPSLQAQSRSNFFNLMRKKSMSSNNSSSKTGELLNCPLDGGSGQPVGQGSGEAMVDLGCNGVIKCDSDSGNEKNNNNNNSSNNESNNNNLGGDVILYSEEEVRFLRSLGWDETAEEGGLTEEEISSFYQNYLKLKPASKFLKGIEPKIMMEVSSNSKLES